MLRVPVILIFDVGKTNKKVLLFNQQYEVVHEESIRFDETTDEDGIPCEDVHQLSNWIVGSFHKWNNSHDFEIKAVNFSAYGASFVLIDERGVPSFPLYNYLKPFPKEISTSFYTKYGREEKFALETASPVLGSLNSGLQLYRLKKEKNSAFQKVKYALHLPQYLSYLLTNEVSTDMTSIGCHTALWNFQTDQYHEWVSREGVEEKLAPIVKKNQYKIVGNDSIIVGNGLHDSSAALIPYLRAFHEPFLLISTGTWSISLNPFNQSPLKQEELKKDCLFYISYNGKPVKASRLFAGHEHEIQLKRLIEYFGVDAEAYKKIKFNPQIIDQLNQSNGHFDISFNPHEFVFSKRTLTQFQDFEAAYHQLMLDIVNMQVESTKLVLENSPVKNIYVVGGFSNNELFIQLISNYFSSYKVFAATVAQASALGAAIALHDQWNASIIPSSLVKIKEFNRL